MNRLPSALGVRESLGLVFGVGAGAAAARLVARERRLRTRAEEARAQTQRLEAVATALLKARTPQEVLDVVMTEGVSAAEARAGVIGLLTPDGREIEVVAHHGYPEGRIDAWARFPIDGPFPLSDAVRTGEPVFLSTSAERDRRYPTFSYIRDKSHALVCLPLRFEERVIGGLTLSFPDEQEFTSRLRGTEVGLAAQAAHALERTRLDEAERRARERLLFLSQASATLASSRDYEATLRRLADLVVPEIADWCVIDMVTEGGRIERVAIAHREPEKVRFGWEFSERYPTDPEAPQGIPQVIRTREPQFIEVIPEEMFIASAQGDEEWLRIMRELGLSSSITVPLATGEHVLGALSLLRAGDRHFTAADFELAQELARRASIAVDNARLRSEVERRADAARALRHVAEAVVLFDRAGRPSYWNEAAGAFFGAGSVPVEQWEALARTLEAQEIPEGIPTTLPVELDGSERWLQVSRVTFDEGCVYAARDVTEERQLDKTRREFVTTASHELRTPIATVYGTFQTLLRDDVTLDPERQREFLRFGLRESERLTRLVDDLLLAGQLEHGTPRVDEVSCDLRSLLADVVRSTAIQLDGTHSLVTEFAEDLQPIRCDPARLRQVLANLIENAVKYSPGGGTVSVTATDDGRMARIAVSDTGIGIPKRDQQRIFERFVRLDPALSRGVGGTGLGLYIARELIERMGGRIAVRSSEGEGSTFTIDVPVAS